MRSRRVGRIVHVKDFDDRIIGVIFTFVGFYELCLPSSASRASKGIAGDTCTADEATLPLVDGLEEEREGIEEKQLRVKAPKKRLESSLVELSQTL